jgi:predicted ribosome quality control (RQC) complex YloA/Tae2 family protein
VARSTDARPTLAFDALTLHAVTDEVRARAVGARVQKLLPLDAWSIAFELYGRGERSTLLVSTDPHAARVTLTSDRAARASEAVTPLLLLLRKYVRDGRVDAADQPSLERVLELRVSKRDDEGDDRDVGLIIEAMGRRSNLVLVSEEGTILDALRRASAEKNPARPIVPHRRYEPPPAQDRLDPLARDAWEVLPARAGAAPDAPLVDLLGKELAGMSGLLAREAAFRATGRLDVPAGAADLRAVRARVGELLAPIRTHAGWAPSVALRDGRVVAFAPYRLHHLEGAFDVRDVDSISDAVERGYRDRDAAGGAAGAGATNENGLTRPLYDAIRARRALVERRRNALERSRAAAGDPDELREIGQALLAAAHEIAPGRDSVTLDGREIELDPRETAVENAQRYFREYKRAREATRRVPELVAQAERELAYLDEMETLVGFADDPGRVKMLRDELRTSGILRDKEPRAPKKGGYQGKTRPADDGPRPLTVPLGDGYVALVGTSAKGNERVTFDLATQDDIWLHARQIPGSHVILRTAGREPPRAILERAAGLAAHFSRSRDDARVAVDWTPRKFVRKIRGGPPGLVSYVNEKTLDVAPRPPA